MIEVRKARPEEGPQLLRLIRALADYEKLAPPDEAAQGRLLNDIFGDRPRLDAYLAYVEGVAVGYALVLETYSSFLALPTLYLEDIFVVPESRGKGAGAALFQAMAREAKRRGCGRMEWVVLDWNRAAQEFYNRFGAEQLTDWQYWRLTQEQIDGIAKE